MLLEEQRFLHEDLERLEQGIADRISEEPRQVRVNNRYPAYIANARTHRFEIAWHAITRSPSSSTVYRRNPLSS